MPKTLYKTLYNASDYTHKEVKERIEKSGVSRRKMIKNLDLVELNDLADAFDLTAGEMLDILLYEM